MIAPKVSHGWLGSSVYNRYSDEETRWTRLDLRSRPEIYATMECGSRSVNYDTNIPCCPLYHNYQNNYMWHHNHYTKREIAPLLWLWDLKLGPLSTCSCQSWHLNSLYSSLACYQDATSSNGKPLYPIRKWREELGENWRVASILGFERCLKLKIHGLGRSR